MRFGFSLGRISGIQIRVDWGLSILFLLVTFNLAVGVFPAWHPQWGLALRWLVAVAAALLFVASVLLHELSHALVARAHGIPIRSITLFIFGGLAEIDREPPSPKAEFLIAAVGPLTSIVIGLICLVLGQVSTQRLAGYTDDPALLLRNVGPLTSLLLWLGPVNILLGIFNLVPGFPLDGGRVLRAVLWAVTGNLRRATRWASTAGQVVSWLLIFAGISMIFGLRVPLLGRGFVPGLWLAFIGWFLNSAAILSYQRVVLSGLLEHVPVARLMRSDVAAVPADLTVDELVNRYIMRTDQRAFPVVDGDRLVGLVCLQDVRKVSQDQWLMTRVAQIMTSGEQLTVVEPDEPADHALRALAQRDIDQVPVVEGGRLRGILRRRDLMRWIELHAAEAPAAS